MQRFLYRSTDIAGLNKEQIKKEILDVVFSKGGLPGNLVRF